jgi:hypothetical protein
MNETPTSSSFRGTYTDSSRVMLSPRKMPTSTPGVR